MPLDIDSAIRCGELLCVEFGSRSDPSTIRAAEQQTQT